MSAAPRLTALALLAALAALAAAPVARGQDAAPAPAPPRAPAPAATPEPAAEPDLAELRRRVAEAEARIARERALLDAARARVAADLEARADRRAALAGEVLELELERLGAAAREEAAREAARASAHDPIALAAELDRVTAAAREAAQGALALVRELPGEEDRVAALERALADLDRARPAGTRARAAAAVAAPLVELLGEASRLRVREVELRTASGLRERVELLAIGHVGFAYRVPGTDRLAFALESPADAQGFRWSEALSRGERRDLERAFGAIAAGERAVLAPLDVSGRLEPRARTDLASLRALIASGGPVMLPILALGALAIVLALERAWSLASASGEGTRRLAPVLEAAREADAARVAALLEGQRGAAARALAACFRAHHAGQEAMEDAVQEQLLREQPRLQRRLKGLAIVAGVAPLLGLLGTVTGIIDVFAVIQAYGNTEPGLLAGGIAEALVTTAAGLLVAIPTLLVHSILAGRAETILADAERSAAGLLCAWREARPRAARSIAEGGAGDLAGAPARAAPAASEVLERREGAPC